MKLVERMPGVCKAVIKEKGGYFEEPPFALMTALHTLGILSTSFMRLSPGMHFN